MRSRGRKLRRKSSSRSFVDYMVRNMGKREEGLENLIQHERDAILMLQLDIDAMSRSLRKDADEELYVRKFGTLQASLKRHKGILRSLYDEMPRYKADLRTDAKETYKKMRAVERVKDIFVKKTDGSEYLIIETDTLFGQSCTGAWHRIGAFKIEIDLRDPGSAENFPYGFQPIRCIRWTNLDGTQYISTEEPERWHAPPQIKEDGLAHCFGDEKGALKKALAAGDWVTVVKMVVRFPECHGRDNWISAWPRATLTEVPAWYVHTFGETLPAPVAVTTLSTLRPPCV